MSRVGLLHCYTCGADIPVGAEVDARDYGRLVAQAWVTCLPCSEKSAAELDRMRERAVPEGATVADYEQAMDELGQLAWAVDAVASGAIRLRVSELVRARERATIDATAKQAAQEG